MGLFARPHEVLVPGHMHLKHAFERAATLRNLGVKGGISHA